VARSERCSAPNRQDPTHPGLDEQIQELPVMRTIPASILAVTVAATVSLAGIVPAAQAELRVGKNQRLTSDSSPFRGKDAVALVADPNDPQHIVEVNANYLSTMCEYTVSRDGGNTWSPAKDFATPQGFGTTCGRGDHLADYSFQTVVFGTGQNVYTTFSAPQGDMAAESVLVAKSGNGGTTFAPAVVAMPGGRDSEIGPYFELPSVTVDPGAGTAGAGADRVIVSAHKVRPVPATAEAGDAFTAVSEDGGQTFRTPVKVEPANEDVAGPDTTSQPVVLPDHSLAIAWRTRAQTGAIRVARSTNAGQTWETPVTTATVTNNGSTGCSKADGCPDPPKPSPATGSSFPRLAVDKIGGNLYLVYNQGPKPPGPPDGGFAAADHFISPDSDVYFQRSMNKGTNWSKPKLINEAKVKPGLESPYSDPEVGKVTQTRHPDVSVAPNGRVDIVWQDRRHWYRGCVHTHIRCAEARIGDTYYAFSGNAGDDFSKNKRISDRSHANDVGFDYRFGTGWAFGPVTAHLGNDQLLVGWMDSREGSFDNDNQDIYLAKVDHNGSAVIPQESINRSNPADTSVRLSRQAYPGGGEGLLASTFATRNGTRVVIANQDDASAILAAGVLARGNLSQVLLSPPGGLTASVKAEVRRLNPAGAFVIGGKGSLSDQVVQDLQAAGVPDGETKRLDGGSRGRAATAQKIADELDRRTDAQKKATTPAFNAVALVNPDSPDASAVSALASARRLPVLFANVASIPQATKDALTALNIDTALVIGGPGVISDAAVAELPSTVTTRKRLGGTDQYGTSRAVVAESIDRGLPDNIAYVADGANRIDGALLGSTVGRVTGLLMLSPAPLGVTAPVTAAANNLSARLDRLILLQPAAAGSPGGGAVPVPGNNVSIPPKATVCRSSAGVRVIGKTNSGGRVFRGTKGDDRICGTNAGDLITGIGGRDVISGGGGNDRINGGSGSDRINGGSGRDLISGNSGNDIISGSSGSDRINGSSGNDRISGNSGNDIISGSSGNDRINGNSGNDRMNGNSGNDTLSGGSGRDSVSGSSGNDRINGNSGKDRVNGGFGDDRLNGSTGNDEVSGSSGNDVISGGSGDDRLSGNSGNDRIDGGQGRDRISGGSGRNQIRQ